MVVEQAEAEGEGKKRAALLKLKEKLAEEGLFDEERKVPLPEFPRRVAVITSPNGAAVQDIIVSIRERMRNVSILVVPVPVQGDAAAGEIARAIGIVDSGKLADVIIVGRGGGSEEDLAAFNEEAVVRAVASCATPIVSAVGHEIDVTLTDLAADRRALTPTAAGKMAVPDIGDIVRRLEGAAEALHERLVRALGDACRRVASAGDGIRRHAPGRRVDELFQKVDAAAGRMSRALAYRTAVAAGRLSAPAQRLRMKAPALSAGRARLGFIGMRMLSGIRARMKIGRFATARQAASLDALNPLAVVGRGYSLTKDADGKPVKSVRALHRGDVVETLLRDGIVISKVEETREQE